MHIKKNDSNEHFEILSVLYYFYSYLLFNKPLNPVYISLNKQSQF